MTDALIAIFDYLKKKKRHIDTVDLMVQINGILNEYIMIEHTCSSSVVGRVVAGIKKK